MAWYSTRNRVRFLLVAGAVLIGLRVYGLYIYPMWAEQGQIERSAQSSVDTNVQRSVEVTRPYTLNWSAQDGRPALRLVIPVADLGAWREARHLVLAETSDGPLQLPLEMPFPGADGLTLESFGNQCMQPVPESASSFDPAGCPVELGRVVLYRDMGDVQPWALRYLRGDAQSVPESNDVQLPGGGKYTPLHFWARTDAGAAGQEKQPDVEMWHFLGRDCPEGETPAPTTDVMTGRAGDPPATRNGCYAPPHWFAQHYPRYFDLRRVNALDHCQGVRTGNCTVLFLYRGRLVKVYSRMSAQLAVMGALDLLERLARDTASAPQAAQTLMRAGRALADCRLASDLMSRHKETAWLLRRYETVSRYQCGLAVQLARSVLNEFPDAASRIMLDAMVDHGYKSVGRDGGWDRWYAEDLLAALARTGKTEGIDVVRAHMLRLRSSGVSAEVRDQSYQALLTLAPRVIGSNTSLFPKIESQLADYLVRKDESSAQLIDFLRATLEHVERESGADSDATFKVRYSYCQRRMWFGVEPKTLDQCADALISHWSRRDPALPDLQESIPPIHLGVYIASMLRRCTAAAGADCTPELNRPRLDVVRRLLARVPGAAQDPTVRRDLGELPAPPDPVVCQPGTESCASDGDEQGNDESEAAEEQDTSGS